jgi:hypothetical protein
MALDGDAVIRVSISIGRKLTYAFDLRCSNRRCVHKLWVRSHFKRTSR